MLEAVDLPDDIAALKAMLIASQLREIRKDERIERLEKLVAAFKQAAFAANPRRPTLSNSILHWKTWKRPLRRFMPKTRPTVLRANRSSKHARPIGALFPPIFLVSKRS